MNIKKTLYDVLQVSGKAEPEMIETAYRMRSEKLNDAVDHDAQNEMKLVRQAYAILSDPAQRAVYDQSILAATSRNRMQINADGMVEENHDEGHSILKWSIAAAVALAATMIVFNHFRDTKKIEIEAQLVSKHLNNEQELVSGTVNNQSKAIDNSSTVSNRMLDLAREQQFNRQIAEERRSAEINQQRESQIEYSRKMQENSRMQQEAQQTAREAQQTARKEEASQEQYRLSMMNKMISMKDWDLARSFAKTTYESSNIDRMEQADRRSAVLIIPNPNTINPSHNTTIFRSSR
jgi:DnaJ-class molecular chaperone with C-terminal Zn finger domain